MSSGSFKNVSFKLFFYKIYIFNIYTPGQNYKTTLKNKEKDTVYNFKIMKIRYKKDKA